MNLLLLPGGGNPDASPLYAKVYGVILREARRYGYKQVHADIRWPGHFTGDVCAGQVITLPGAVAVTSEAILRLPPEPYAILARSFGCAVALKLAMQGFPSGRLPQKIILWGPSPYWLMWQMWVKEFPRNQAAAKNKGLSIGEHFQATMEPVEFLLQHVSIPTFVAAGTRDPYCTPAFSEYLHRLSASNRWVKCVAPVDGAPHEVTDDDGAIVVAAYATALFDNKDL